MFTFVQSFMSVKHIIDEDVDVHDAGHHLSPVEAPMADVLAWHVGHFACLVNWLRAVPEGDGTLLDNTALLLIHGDHISAFSIN